jgi:hypothetical protein
VKRIVYQRYGESEVLELAKSLNWRRFPIANALIEKISNGKS